MKFSHVAAGAVALGLAFTAQTASAAAPECEIDRPVVFAGLDWDSNRFHNAVAEQILQAGYGCQTDEIPGSTLPLLAGMARGDIDITMEMWIDNVKEAWQEAVDKGQVAAVGVNFPDAVQGWWVPRYVIEGDKERGIEPMAPNLKSVADLPNYVELFKDPEEPDKGRFYNCILGWACEVINTKKLTAYGLDKYYTNFRPGTGAALAAAIASNYRRGRPIVAYYWGPTWVLGKYDMVMLEEPEYTEACWNKMHAEDEPEEACAYPLLKIYTAVNTKFQEQAPRLVEFLSKYRTSNLLVSQALAYMQDNEGATPKDAAINFLKSREDVWTKWVPADVAERVRASLD